MPPGALFPYEHRGAARREGLKLTQSTGSGRYSAKKKVAYSIVSRQTQDLEPRSFENFSLLAIYTVPRAQRVHWEEAGGITCSPALVELNVERWN